jgi:D-alanyl-D-alanine carboxypeptidase
MANDPTHGFGLDPQFAATLKTLLEQCAAMGLDFRIAQGLRTPQTQAKYYCQWVNHSPSDVDARVAKMQNDGAPWLASVLQEYRDIPRKPNWLTSQLPGSGWHQWGEAADCYCYRNGQMVQNGSDPCYKKYADAARALGLTAGFYFSKQDSGHVQKRAEAGATNVYSWAEIDTVMRERFSDKPAVA